MEGWLRDLDLTRGSLGQGLSQLQAGTGSRSKSGRASFCDSARLWLLEVWADIEREAKSPNAVYLVVEARFIKVVLWAG